MKIHYLPLVAATLAIVAACTSAPTTTTTVAAANDPLIPRSVIFGNPERTGGRISPDGKYISFLAPRDGVLNVWVVERGKPISEARPLTNERVRPIRGHFWSANSEEILYGNDKNGDENVLLYAVNARTGAERTLTDY